MNVFDELQKELEKTNITEFELLNLSIDGVLTIIGSFDSSYNHDIEIYIKNPSYISLPKYFEYPTFRRATEQEKQDLKRERFLSNDIDGTVICVELDKGFDKFFEKHYIIAEDFSYKFGVVYHYKRENLKEGERIAEWIK